MRVLGIDPGLTRCGLGVVDSGAGRSVTLVDVRVARSDAAWELPERLGAVADVLHQVLDAFAPQAIALERVFAQHNVSTVMGTAQISGVAMYVARERGIPVAMYTPTEVKAAITGSGRADKAQVTFMVTRVLGLDAPPRPADAADALAIAVAHAWKGAGRAAAPGAKTPTAAQARWEQALRDARGGA